MLLKKFPLFGGLIDYLFVKGLDTLIYKKDPCVACHVMLQSEDMYYVIVLCTEPLCVPEIRLFNIVLFLKLV